MGWGTAEVLSGQRHLLFRDEDPIWLQGTRVECEDMNVISGIHMVEGEN